MQIINTHICTHTCVCVCVYKLTGWIKLSTFVICRNSASCMCMHAKLLSCVWFFATLWSIAYRAPLFMGFARQKYWSGLPCPPPGDLPDTGIELPSPALVGRFFTTEAPRKLKCTLLNYIFLIIIPNCPPNCRSFKSWLLLLYS